MVWGDDKKAQRDFKEAIRISYAKTPTNRSSMTAPELHLVTNDDATFDADKPILVKPGDYKLILSRTWKGYLYGKAPKLILVFRILTEGSYYGYHIYRCYNIKGLTKRNEIIPKGWHSDYVREYSRLFGAPRKLKDIGVRQYKNKVFVGNVRTVEKDSKQRPLPDDMKYSVIDELTEVIVG